MKPSWVGLLGADLAIGLDGDVVIRRERVDLVLGELGTGRLSVSIYTWNYGMLGHT